MVEGAVAIHSRSLMPGLSELPRMVRDWAMRCEVSSALSNSASLLYSALA